MKDTWPYLALAAVCLAADQITKHIVDRTVALYDSITVIPGFFNISRIHNKGAIFGFLGRSDNPLVFLLLKAASIAALIFVVVYFLKTPPSEKGTRISLSLIAAGALGNQIDRWFRGYVIDFLDFHIRGRHWPFFNVADSCITVGALLLVWIYLRRRPECSPSSSASDR
ncbi:MAG: signal peptidase II [Acidobacteriota bacterium]|nr:signal peptidase II [Acidobacteriota bacterium]